MDHMEICQNLEESQAREISQEDDGSLGLDQDQSFMQYSECYWISNNDICSKYYKTQDMVPHVIVDHIEKCDLKLMNCCWANCEERDHHFETQDNLIDHVVKHFEDITFDFICPDCEEKYSDVKDFVKHRESHTNRTIKVSCKHCIKNFSCYSKQQTNVKCNALRRANTYSCPEDGCQKEFINFKNCEKHFTMHERFKNGDLVRTNKSTSNISNVLTPIDSGQSDQDIVEHLTSPTSDVSEVDTCTDVAKTLPETPTSNSNTFHSHLGSLAYLTCEATMFKSKLPENLQRYSTVIVAQANVPRAPPIPESIRSPPPMPLARLALGLPNVQQHRGYVPGFPNSPNRHRVTSDDGSNGQSESPTSMADYLLNLSEPSTFVPQQQNTQRTPRRTTTHSTSSPNVTIDYVMNLPDFSYSESNYANIRFMWNEFI